MKSELKLTEKDRKILAELDHDARTPDSQISKRVKLSKQVTNYRIKNLTKKGIISNFYTVIDVGKLGFSSHYVFLQLQSITESEETKLMEKLKGKEYVGWLVNGTGRWDAVVLIYSKSTLEFNNYLNDLLSACGDKVHDYIFTTLISAEHLGYKFFGPKAQDKALQTEKASLFTLDKKDKEILRMLSQNARLSSVEISAKTNLPVHSVRYRLKELRKKGIIEAFKPKVEVNKLGLQWHLLLIQFTIKEESRKKEFVSYCEKNKNVYYVTNTIGNYNLMLDIHVKSTEEFKRVLLDLKEKFSDVIKLYESIIIFEEYKIDYFTKLFV